MPVREGASLPSTRVAKRRGAPVAGEARARAALVVALTSVAACRDGGASTGAGSSESTGTGPTATSVGTTSGDTMTSSSSDSGGTTGADGLPPTPTLVSPADGATDVPIETELCWNPVEDPDGEPVRYRVFVDDIELTEGIMGEVDGHAGPCVGPLTFVHEQTYTWQVQAFEEDAPDRMSDKSEAWSFTTEDDGATHTVFEDDFGDDLGWVVSGDAATGAWVRGDPVAASHLGALSQSGRCDGGQSCYFTGQNPIGLADDEDVSGGSTVLTSPPFDLEGAAAATVQLRRFFYKSAAESGPLLRVELLVPNAGAPDGYDPYILDQLEATTSDTPANLWTPREYAACGVPMAAGSRLRITATDAGAGILEAAIDSVLVRAHDFATVCGTGEGAICDPSAGASACPDELLCCSQGTINAGVYRCTPAVAGLDFDAPPPTPDSPNDGPLGCDAPDLIIDESWIQPVSTDIFVSQNTCELLEGCVGGLGWRTILRFSIVTPNIGSTDLVLGVAANNPDVFHYSECHAHYHFDEFARYELRDAGGVVASGHKQAFCLLDDYSWAWPNTPVEFDCANQGISRGFADSYESDLPCQWIDVTDVPPGDYTLRATLNQPRPDSALPLLNERDYDNNTVEVPVSLQ